MNLLAVGGLVLMAVGLVKAIGWGLTGLLFFLVACLIELA